ncbi:MAG: AAA family ATPase [Betaproteobacteria bacterium]|nr:AAA family ATPase [Betaproteobacteria bacterium]
MIGSSDTGSAVNLRIDDNNLIFLCGKNNAGKSTVLSAYEMFVVANREADSHDFFNKDPANHIVIEASVRAETENDHSHQALSKLWDKDGIARIRKTWKDVGEKGDKESFDPQTGQWKEGGAGGFDTLLQNAFPTPVWIRGTSTPDEVLALLRTLVQETILRNISGDQVYVDAIDAIKKLDAAITQNEYASSLQKNLNNAVTSVFPNVSFAIRNDGAKDVTELFKSTATIDIQENEHPSLGLSSHGHGVRRQFIMSAFRGLALQLEEVKKSAKQRKPENYQISEIVLNPGTAKSRMLLVEEPELFLHPSAVRSVRDLLFLLASSSEFQVIAATHSPVIIDLSRPHTTLARVSASANQGAVLHQVSHTLFSDEERETMKMLNYFDPYVCEAFFSSKVVLVEGDTEAVAIRELLSRMNESQPDPTLGELHVVNCGTKMNIPFFQKVLTHFRIDYHVLHDMDSKLNSNGGKSSAWTLNERIWEGILQSRKAGVNADRYVFNTEFESANGYELDEALGKPFSAYREASKWALDDDTKAAVQFLRHIVQGTQPVHEFTQEMLEELANGL